MNNNQKYREKGKKADGTQEKGKNKMVLEMKNKSQGTHGNIDANQNFMRGTEERQENNHENESNIMKKKKKNQ